MTRRLSRCLPMTLDSRNAGMAVTTKATSVKVSGWSTTVRSPRTPRGKLRSEPDHAMPEVHRQAEDRAQLDDDGEGLPVGIAQIDAEHRLDDPQMRRGAHR